MNNQTVGSAYTVTSPPTSDLVVEHGASAFWTCTKAFSLRGKPRLHLVTYCPTREAVRVWDAAQNRWRAGGPASPRAHARIKAKWFREINKEWVGRKLTDGVETATISEVSPVGVGVAWESGVRTIERFDRVLDGWLPLPGKKVGA